MWVPSTACGKLATLNVVPSTPKPSISQHIRVKKIFRQVGRNMWQHQLFCSRHLSSHLSDVKIRQLTQPNRLQGLMQQQWHHCSVLASIHRPKMPLVVQMFIDVSCQLHVQCESVATRPVYVRSLWLLLHLHVRVAESVNYFRETPAQCVVLCNLFASRLFSNP